MADPSITRNTRTYILATLFASLAATALIAMFSVILCPARVTFTVTHASRDNLSSSDTVSLYLSIFANTSQRRTKVKFESIFIDLLNSSGPLGREDDWQRRINAHFDVKMSDDDYVKYPGSTNINVSAAAPKRKFLDSAPDWLIDNVGLTVTVMAQVHFMVGVVRTRLYSITVYCDEVVFPSREGNAEAPSAVKPPVTCHN